jgi:hypothetical protein
MINPDRLLKKVFILNLVKAARDGAKMAGKSVLSASPKPGLGGRKRSMASDVGRSAWGQKLTSQGAGQLVCLVPASGQCSIKIGAAETAEQLTNPDFTKNEPQERRKTPLIAAEKAEIAT